MNVHIYETGEDIDLPLEAQKHRTAPTPFTRDRNQETNKVVMGEVKMDEERIPGMMRESTVWDVYNNEARKVDNEFVKDWTASLNFLLVFAAIFAAVLTAFIIESKKMLEQDQTEVLVDIAIQYFNSIGNQSRNNITRPDFEPTFEAISINCLLFASLGASLVAALASVVALQWVADYDAAITRGGSSPLDRAKRRQFRFAGVTRWKMGEIIATLPLLLYSSVVLFWAGAVQWMWTLHHIVGYVVAGGTAIAVLFYASTTLLSAVFVSSPFRTPLSRGLYWLPLWLLSLVGHFLLWLPIERAIRFSEELYQTISSYMKSLVASGVTLDGRSTDSLSLMPALGSTSAGPPLSSSIPEWIKAHTTSPTSRQREDETAKRDPLLEQEGLAWLAQQLPISGDAHERLLLCISGIPLLSTENPPSPRFHDAPWVTILDVLSEYFLRQIFDQTSPDMDYQAVGILLHCVASPFIRSMVVPDSSYTEDPAEMVYWTQCTLEYEGIPFLEVVGSTPMTFLLARDAPLPSLGSKHELEATWKLIKWRNSVNAHYWMQDDGVMVELNHRDAWPEVYSDIRRYSSEFLESCLCYFRKWTDVLRFASSGSSHYAVMFDSIAKQALHRDNTIGEALALVRAFASYLTATQRYEFPEPDDETNIIPQPLLYTRMVRLSESTRATHLAITLILIRAARLYASAESQQCARWITYLLWISTSNEAGSSNALQGDRIRGSEEIQNIWDEIEMSPTGVVAQGAHVEEIGRELWRVDNAVMMSLSRDAFKNPQSATDTHQRYLELLLQWIPHCEHHHTGSQHILLHLIGFNPQEHPHCIFRITPVRLESINWAREQCNPILAMLALSDTQDLTCLTFGGGVDLECARHILGIVKAVKTRPAEFLCLLADIIRDVMRKLSRANPALLLESIRQTMAFLDEESTAPFLRPMALKLQEALQFGRKGWAYGYTAVEVKRVCHLFQAKYAASLISPTAQLRLLSCTRFVAVEHPGTGWLRMHVPL